MAEGDAPTQPDQPTRPQAPDVDAPAVYCPLCMYDMRGLSSDSCPECGAELDQDKLAHSSLPWVHASFVMRLLPPVRTAFRVIFRPRTFAQEIARPGDRRAALRFRRAIVWWTFMPLAVFWFLCVWVFELDAFEIDAYYDVKVLQIIDEHLDTNPDHTIVFNRLLPLILGPLFWLYLYLATGVHTYWFHPKRLPLQLQERALSLSYYACAPLMLLWVPFAMLLAVMVFDESDLRDAMTSGLYWLFGSLAFAGLALVPVLLVLTLLRCVRYAGLLAQRSVLGQLAMVAALPICWLALAVLVFGAIPLVAFFVYVVFATL